MLFVCARQVTLDISGSLTALPADFDWQPPAPPASLTRVRVEHPACRAGVSALKAIFGPLLTPCWEAAAGRGASAVRTWRLFKRGCEQELLWTCEAKEHWKGAGRLQVVHLH